MPRQRCERMQSLSFPRYISITWRISHYLVFLIHLRPSQITFLYIRFCFHSFRICFRILALVWSGHAFASSSILFCASANVRIDVSPSVNSWLQVQQLKKKGTEIKEKRRLTYQFTRVLVQLLRVWASNSNKSRGDNRCKKRVSILCLVSQLSAQNGHVDQCGIY